MSTIAGLAGRAASKPRSPEWRRLILALLMGAGFLVVAGQLVRLALRGQPVGKEIDTGCVLVTAENLGEPAIADLINPPLDRYLK